MRHLLLAGTAAIVIAAAAGPAAAQNGASRVQQLAPAAQPPVAVQQAPAPPVTIAPVPAAPPQMQAQAAPAPAAPPAPAAAPQTRLPDASFEQLVGEEVVDRRRVSPYALGAGAILGVVVFNVASTYFAPAMMMAGGPLAGTVVGNTAVAASRVYAVSSAVAGSLTAYWLSQKLAD